MASETSSRHVKSAKEGLGGGGEGFGELTVVVFVGGRRCFAFLAVSFRISFLELVVSLSLGCSPVVVPSC